MKMSSDDYCLDSEVSGRITFAFKLFEVANDGKLIKWNSTGDGVIVDKSDYEKRVQDLYPGFVQTSSFLNLKRLFRDYAFTYRVLRRKKPLGLITEFSNPYFRRYDFENLKNVKAKERIYKYRIQAVSSSYPLYRTRRKYTRRFPTRSIVNLKVRKNTSRELINSFRRPLIRKSVRLSTSDNDPTLPEKHTKLIIQDKDESFLRNKDIFQLFQLFAQNELPEETYVEIILKKFGDQLEHLAGGPFDELVKSMNDLMTPEFSPFLYSEVFHEIPLSEM